MQLDSVVVGSAYPWLDDRKQVPADHQLLCKAVVLFGLEEDSEESHDARVAGQVQ